MQDINKILEDGDKVKAGLPYLYRSKGLPSEVYEVRFTKEIEEDILNIAIEDATERYPYFNVRFEEKDGDFYAVKNEIQLKAHHTEEFIALGGRENDFHLMGISFWGTTLRISFHHGLTDGRGAKSFLEAIVTYYNDYFMSEPSEYSSVKKDHLDQKKELSESELSDPVEGKYVLDKKVSKIDGLQKKGYHIPEAGKKSEHRRYELKFSQTEYMAKCKAIGASPITYLSMLVSRAIKTVNPDCDQPIVSNFPVDARKILGMDDTFKNCVKSMSLPYGEEESLLSDAELAKLYKELLAKQRDKDYCAQEFNNIHMLLGVVDHFHSVASRKMLLKFMENLELNTYLISYIGQFQLPETLVEEVHLYSNCSGGLLFNMTCQSGCFVIDMIQDFETDKYVNAIKKMFEEAGVSLQVSDEIIFETPLDELSEIVTSPANMQEQIQRILEQMAENAREASEAAKTRAMEAQKSNGQIQALYYDRKTKTMKTFDPTKERIHAF